MSIDIKSIKRLKNLTGVGLTDAKIALEQAKGNFDLALKEMRKKGLTKADKRSEKEARQGLIGSYNHDNRIGVIVEVNCETDFVARNELFINLVKDIAMHIAATNPNYLSPNDIDQPTLNNLKDEFRAKNNDKPSNVVDKIIEGQLKKYYQEKCLLKQSFIKNPDQTIEQLVKEHIAKLGENIIIRRFHRLALGEIN